MRLGLHIALRFLRSNITQTLIIILAIGIGVSVQIFIGSLIQGLQKSLVGNTIGSSSQITLVSGEKGGVLEDYERLGTAVLSADERIRYVSPVSDHPAFFESGENSQSVLVRGFDFSAAEGIYKLGASLTEGRLPSGTGEVLLGEGFRDEYGLSVGSEITLTTPGLQTASFRVSGFFDLKVAQINTSWSVMTLDSAQRLFETGNTVTALELQVFESDVFEADEIADHLEASVGGGIKTTNWKGQNEQLLSGLQGQSISSLMIQIFVMLSVVLGIASILAITVMQKSRQIGILKAMGIKNSTASLVFLFEGLILGIFGAVAGIGLGIGLASAFSAFALNADGTPVVALFIDPSFIALSGIVAALACVIASLIPARRSSKLDPIEIIRGN